MVNMLQISSSKNPGGEKLDDIAYIFVDIASSKTLYEKPQKGKTHIKKRVQCIICLNIIHQKPLWEKWMI